MKYKKSDLLKPEYLLNAYASGIFPMSVSEFNGEILWFSPDPRGIIPLDNFHIPGNLKKIYNKKFFEIKINSDFKSVIENCADSKTRKQDSGNWISEELINAYLKLHKLGYAHSVETYWNGSLAGGLYGVSINGAFFGESMFFNVKDASKIALVALINKLIEKKFILLDTQYINPHLLQFGAIEIPKQEYLKLLDKALLIKTKFV